MSDYRTISFKRTIRSRLAWLLVFLFGCLPATNREAYAADPATKWKAAFIINCTAHFKWPTRESENRFLIGIIGNDEVRSLVEKGLSGQKIGNKTVHVISAAASDIPNCHLVYIASSRPGSALSQAKGNAVLTIGETDDGFMAWFTTTDGSLTAKGNMARIQKEALSCNAKIGNVLFKK